MSEFTGLVFPPATLPKGVVSKAFDKVGFLIKLGKNFKSWKERAFGLDKSHKTLFYFDDLLSLKKHEDGVDPKNKSKFLLGEISLVNAHLYSADSFMPHKNCFEIVTPQRNYFLVAKDELSLGAWLWELHQPPIGCKLLIPAAQGWLEKKGDWNSSLQRRFFRTELFGPANNVKRVLSYYETFGEKPKGHIELDGAELSSGAGLQPLFFSIKPSGKKRVYEFKAGSEQELKYWLTELKHVINGTKMIEEEEKTWVNPEVAQQLAAKKSAAAAAVAEKVTSAASGGAGGAGGAGGIVFGMQLGASLIAAGSGSGGSDSGAAGAVGASPKVDTTKRSADVKSSAGAYPPLTFDSGDETAIVIDNGSSSIKIGMSGEDLPRLLFPSVIGRPKAGLGLDEPTATGGSGGASGGDTKSSSGGGERFIGEEAQQRANVLSIASPIAHGVVTNWDDMELLWEYAFSGLVGTAKPSERPVLVSEPVQNPRNNREMYCQVLFEKFGACGMSVSPAPLLSLYAAGRTEGLVVEVGGGVTSCVPVSDARPNPIAAVRTNFGGIDLTNYLMRLLTESGVASFRTAADRHTVNGVKEMHCYVATNYADEIKRTTPTPPPSGDAKTAVPGLERSFEHPTGPNQHKTITIGQERFKVSEALFTPSLIGSQYPGVHESAATVIKACDPSIQKQLWSNVVVSGGCTLLDGFVDRMRKELLSLAPPNTSVNVVATDKSKRALSTWIGGSIVAGLPSFAAHCITRAEYQEVGINIVHRRQ